MRMAEDSGQLLGDEPRLLPADMPEFVQGAASREDQLYPAGDAAPRAERRAGRDGDHGGGPDDRAA